MSLAEDIQAVFVAKGYLWKMGEDRHIPTVEDIQKVMDHAKTILDAEPDEELQLEVGRLLFKKRDNTIDVFVMYGEI